MLPRHFFALFAAVAAFTTALPAHAARQVIDFDPGWRFSLSSAPMGMMPAFDDSAWQVVDLPHDWSIDGPFLPIYASGNGYAPGGQAWYRRHFKISSADRGRLVTLELDGVYDNSEVWLNGYLVGGRPYGFESYTCDLTPLLNFDGDNVIAVRVDHSRIADSRWYTGSGIYRNVRLVLTDALHLEHWGTFVTTPVVTGSSATVQVETEVDNGSVKGSPFTLRSDLVAPDGDVVASLSTGGAVVSGTSQALVQRITIPKPQLWSPDSPAMYTLRSRLSDAGGVIDETTTPFGIRTIAFDPNHGFSLNGVPTKLKGVCIHQDGGSVGTAIPIQVWERRLRTLKTLGVNAIRTSHNPPAPEFLDQCDRLGFLVMDEAFDEFTPGKNKWVEGLNQGLPSRFGYNEYFAEWSVRDISDMVRRDRNHPGIIMWSIGNEIDYPNDPFSDPALGNNYKPGNPPGTDMVKWGRPLVAVVKAQDPTRPVTAALASVAMSNAVGFAQILDVDGYNYQEPRYADDHKQYPARVMYGSENKHDYQSWLAVRDNPAISGQFLWTGIDYLGEAKAWPERAGRAGLLDLCGFVKPLGRFRESLWSDHPVVYICAARQDRGGEGDPKRPRGMETWNWPAGTSLTVACFTNCPQVTLTLNGKSLGTRLRSQAVDGALKWEIPFAPGVLRAIGQDGGRTLCDFSLKTAGAPASIALRPDITSLQADGKDVAQIEFDVLDADGVRVPDADQELTFALTGPAKILGIGNGDTTNSEAPKAPRHRTFNGRGLAIIQATTTPGPITLTVSAPGLKTATLQLQSHG